MKTSKEYWDHYSSFEADVRDSIIELINKKNYKDEILFAERAAIVSCSDDIMLGLKVSDESVFVLGEDGEGNQIEVSIFESDFFNVVDYIWILEQLQNY